MGFCGFFVEKCFSYSTSKNIVIFSERFPFNRSTISAFVLCYQKKQVYILFETDTEMHFDNFSQQKKLNFKEEKKYLHKMMMPKDNKIFSLKGTSNTKPKFFIDKIKSKRKSNLIL